MVFIGDPKALMLIHHPLTSTTIIIYQRMAMIRRKTMALTDTVEYSLREAQENLRNALAFSARNEKPYVSKHIADMLANIDNIIDTADVIEHLKELEQDSD